MLRSLVIPLARARLNLDLDVTDAIYHPFNTLLGQWDKKNDCDGTGNTPRSVDIIYYEVAFPY